MPKSIQYVLGIIIAISLQFGLTAIVRADSVVAFNEIMYHPPENEAGREWLELHNQLIRDVDISGWSIQGGVKYEFPEGTIIPGEGFLIVAAAPEQLEISDGITGALGPFKGRLSNSGEKLSLVNNSGRVMDQLEYHDGGQWPAAADGSGVSLAKKNEDSASAEASNWVASIQIGGTPGESNFPEIDTTPVYWSLISNYGEWRYDDSGSDLGTAWREVGYDDSQWKSGRAAFYLGTSQVAPEPTAITTLFSTGLSDTGEPLMPGQPDEHYSFVPDNEAALAMVNHPAWLANDGNSQWIGLSGQGTDVFPPGQYRIRTTFDLGGWDSTTAKITLWIAVDDVLDAVLLNGVDTGIRTAGFGGFNGPFTIQSGFAAGENQLEFRFTNGGASPNPSGLRVKISGTATPRIMNTQLAEGAITYYFRKEFSWEGDPQATMRLKLNHLVDDGAIFYLNGQEIYRYNLPSGAVNYDTLAESEIGEAQFSGPVAVPADSLVVGRNVLAVELHEAAGSTLDALFAADLELQETPPGAEELPTVAFNEVAPAIAEPFWLELVNYGQKPINLTGFVLSAKGSITEEYVFPEVSINAGEFLVLDESVLGFHPADEDKLFLYDAGRKRVPAAVIVKNSLRGRNWACGGRWLYPTESTPGESNIFSLHDEIVINEIMYHQRPIPASPPSYQTTVLIPEGVMAYTLVPKDDHLGRSWTGGTEPFDDSSWIHGNDKVTGVGYETSPADYSELIGTDIGGQMYQQQTSLYIRIPFTIDDAGAIDSLTLKMKYDDGFVAYINGVEVAHANAPGRDGNTDALTWNSHATTSHDDSQAVVFSSYDISEYIPVLHTGLNILAIQGLNWATGSSDLLIMPKLVTRRIVHTGSNYQESPEAWIELYNRSELPVDLGGWKLTEGIKYQFDAGTILAPGQYLLVAADAAWLKTKYPELNIIGDFQGKLSHKDDIIRLIDNNRNPADEVHYYDRGSWPQYADGGGSSLELRDPRADNSIASSWAASNESDKSRWKRYSYSGIASPPPGSNNPSYWHEFVFGLLDAGEILIDDISVIEDPCGTAIELIQNGSFSSGSSSWRMLGNHAFGTVVTDPSNPANQVLHLVATGPTEHMHNHVETTLAGNRSIVNGRRYKISFRAKWLAGCNQLNTRLYFNRLAATTLLAVPEYTGTPGRENSRYEANIGPVFSGTIHSPAVPRAGDDVTITSRVSDPDGVDQVNLWWSVDGGLFQGKTMSVAADGTYTAVITAPSAGAVVQYYLQGRDSLGAEANWPADGQEGRVLFKVDDGLAYGNSLHTLRVIMTAADTAFLHDPTNVMSNYRMKGTVIYNEKDIYYNVGIRLKGSGYGRNNNRVGYNIRFQPEHRFKGVHELVAIDRNGGPGGIGASQRELVLKHIGNHAGGIPGMYDDIIYLISPRSNLNGTAQLLMGRYDDDYLASQYQDGTDGNLYEFELIYYTDRTTDGNPESLKLSPNHVLAVDFRDMGDNKEAYRWNYLLKNNRQRDDFSRIMEMAGSFDLNATQLEQRMGHILDIDEWMRVFAFESLGGVGDTYNQGLAHNLMLYVRPADNRIMAFPWDIDFAFYQSVSASIYGYGSALQKVIAIPQFRRLFEGHLYDIIQTTFNQDYLTYWVNHYGVLTRQGADGEILSRIAQRRAFVLEQLPTEVPFTITTNNGADFSVNSNEVTLRGRGWIDVHTIRLAGHDTNLAVNWTGHDSWQVILPVKYGPNVFTLQAFDYHGRLLSDDTITVTGLLQGNPLVDYLRVTELMYAPLGGSNYEYIELQNRGPESLDISKVVISGAVEFDFSNAKVNRLEPGEYVVVVGNAQAFQSRYGMAVRVAGEFTGKLANEGERVIIARKWGDSIISFDYDDEAGWPAASDGAGYSLVVRESAIAGEPDGTLDLPENWRASTFIYGSPGEADPDHSFNLDDFAGLAKSWLSTAGGPDWNPAYDLPPYVDGTVDLRDLTVFAERWLDGEL